MSCGSRTTMTNYGGHGGFRPCDPARCPLPRRTKPQGQRRGGSGRPCPEKGRGRARYRTISALPCSPSPGPSSPVPLPAGTKGLDQWPSILHAYGCSSGLLGLPTWPNSRIGELLPHRWRPISAKRPAMDTFRRELWAMHSKTQAQRVAARMNALFSSVEPTVTRMHPCNPCKLS